MTKKGHFSPNNAFIGALVAAAAGVATIAAFPKILESFNKKESLSLKNKAGKGKEESPAPAKKKGAKKRPLKKRKLQTKKPG